MKFESPLIEGVLIKRYKRFLADIELQDGSVVTAHCANSGSMKGCNIPGSRVLIREAENPNRKLKYDWELIRIGTTWACVNTSRPNQIVFEAIRDKRLPGLKSWRSLRREVKYGKNSRIDILLETARGPYYVEVKNVTLVEDGAARFPDAVTVRGQKHNRELADMARRGARAAVFFLVNREDACRFQPAWDIDPAYGESLVEAAEAGVKIFCRAARLSPKGIEVDEKLPVDLVRTV